MIYKYLQSIGISQIIARYPLLILLLFSSFSVFSQSAKVNKVWLEHGTQKNGEKGMTIHADITVKGMKGKKIQGIAYFYNSEKKKLMGGVNGYKTRSGQVCASDYGTPSYEDSHYSDFDIFIPYNSLPLASGKHTYYVLVDVVDTEKNNFLSDNRNYVSFTGTGNNNSIQNHQANNNERNDGGSNSVPMYVDCAYCNGTGKSMCTFCGGQGYRMVSNFVMYVGYVMSNVTCTVCSGTGKTYCWHCNSTGKVVNPNHPYVLGGSPVGSGEGSGSSVGSSSGNSSGYTKCTSCNGTGRCSSCNGRGYRFNSYSMHDDSCPGCRGKGSCPICYGRGKIRL